jgi:hypothetical protein
MSLSFSSVDPSSRSFEPAPPSEESTVVAAAAADSEDTSSEGTRGRRLSNWMDQEQGAVPISFPWSGEHSKVFMNPSASHE